MKHFLIHLLMAGVATFSMAQSSSSVVIDDVTVIDVKGGPPQMHRSVIVHGTRILAVVGPEEREKTRSHRRHLYRRQRQDS